MLLNGGANMRATSIGLLAVVGLGVLSMTGANAASAGGSLGIGPFGIGHMNGDGLAGRHIDTDMDFASHRHGRRFERFFPAALGVSQPPQVVQTVIYVPYVVAVAAAPEHVNPGPKIIMVGAFHPARRAGGLPSIVYGTTEQD
jgi:hypothetical protein